VTLLAFAAERRPCSNRSISPGRRAHSSKPTTAECGVRFDGTDGQTDRRTNAARQFYRPSTLRIYASSVIKVSPRDNETICPTPMAVRSKNRTADLRPSADGSAVRSSLVAGGGKAAGSRRAYSLGSCAMGQADGRIALFQNIGWGHNNEVITHSHGSARVL